MTTAEHDNPSRLPRRSRKLLLALPVLAIVLAGGLWAWSALAPGEDSAAQATYTVRRGPLVISVTENGSISNRDKIVIKNEVPRQVAILWLIEEGTRVKKGDLLIELDAADFKDAKQKQQITLLNADAEAVEARENLAVQKNEAQAAIEQAELDLTFARSDLTKYVEGEYPQQLASAEAQITLAEEDLQRASDKLEWSRRLAGEGYITGSELEADEAAVQRARLDLKLARGELDLLTKHTHVRKLQELKSAIRQAELALDRTKRKAKADVIRAESRSISRTQQHKREADRLKEIQQQIAQCTIRAPADGAVVYATTGQFSWRGNVDPLAKGVEVRPRQELIYLPTDETVMAAVKIHESQLRKLRVGLPARITVDALPGKVFHGEVGKISLYPDGTSVWLNPDLKLYSTDVYIEEGDVGELRAGMGCRVEIIVQALEDALFVPVQAVVRESGRPRVYVMTDAGPRPRDVRVGLDNGRMIHILDGLDEGQRVLLAPPLSAAGKAGPVLDDLPATRPAPAGPSSTQPTGRRRRPSDRKAPSRDRRRP